MPWAKSKSFLEKTQLGSIIMYLVCLGGYTIDAVGEFYDWIRADIFGFTFFSLFIASTILLRLEDEDLESEELAPDSGATSASQ
tara:strand:+ start:102 stop:353 length:252 start_codon:yes stop_codon:yes gene_type:complete